MSTAAFNQQLKSRWSRWLDRRIPPSSSVTLDQRRIFIFPSRTGFFFAVCLLVMLVAAINYQNNMSFALTFLLANLFVVAVLHSYANLAGLTISAVGTSEVFVGGRVAFRFRLSAREGRGHYALQVGWPQKPAKAGKRRLFRGLLSDQAMRAAAEVSLEPGEQRELKLHLPVTERGWFSPGRLRIETVYPLGLLRCWTWVDLDMRALVYPAPVAGIAPAGEEGGSPEGQRLQAGEDEFFGIRSYREGDSLRSIHWKSYARGQELQSKQYATTVADALWLDWDQFPGLGQEQRLSVLCQHVLDYHRREWAFGLRLPGVELARASGDGQRERALNALAVYGLDREQPQDSSAGQLRG